MNGGDARGKTERERGVETKRWRCRKTDRRTEKKIDREGEGERKQLDISLLSTTPRTTNTNDIEPTISRRRSTNEAIYSTTIPKIISHTLSLLCQREIIIQPQQGGGHTILMACTTGYKSTQAEHAHDSTPFISLDKVPFASVKGKPGYGEERLKQYWICSLHWWQSCGVEQGDDGEVWREREREKMRSK
jgi:hypothetical protein